VINTPEPLDFQRFGRVDQRWEILVIRVGVALLPEVDPARDDRWARAEELGFAHAWCFDHLAWRSLADSDWHATVPTLAAAAMHTSTVSIGTFVASPNFRHPVPFAKDLMTLDVMSRGRLIAAIGAGAPGFDAAMLGGPELSPTQRHARFEEFVTLLDVVLRERRSNWDGTYFRALEARSIPGPVQQPRPPFVIAANGPRGMRLALRNEGWATMGFADHGAEPEAWWRGVAQAVARFDELAEQAGGAGENFARYLDLMALAAPMGTAEKLLDDAGRAAELGFTDIVVPWPRDSDPFAGSLAAIEEFADGLTAGAVT
jgi:alkanesulfonate monooxygenase SsuD/methylene tetrahydromethanopterin reductase-like flavin-dependent oxidoreductase (luciferase family)